MKPYIVIEWNDTETEAKGWLCIFNFVKGYSGGGNCFVYCEDGLDVPDLIKNVKPKGEMDQSKFDRHGK